MSPMSLGLRWSAMAAATLNAETERVETVGSGVRLHLASEVLDGWR
jgi:hypothetical protein